MFLTRRFYIALIVVILLLGSGYVLAPFFVRKAFKKTGNIWLGAIVVSLIFAAMGVMKASMTTSLLP